MRKNEEGIFCIREIGENVLACFKNGSQFFIIFALEI